MPCKADYSRNEDEAVLASGNVSVHVSLKDWEYSFWADGKRLTTCGFRNLGYVHWDREPSTMLPGGDYMYEHRYMPYMVNELSLAPGENV